MSIPQPEAAKHRPFTNLEIAALNAFDSASAQPLTAAELVAVSQTRQRLLTYQAGSPRRERLHAARDTLDIRWPSWLAAIEEFLKDMTPLFRDHVIHGLECAACGLGFRWWRWPVGVGVLLANDVVVEEAVGADLEMAGVPLPGPRPRLLTLGSHTLALLLEGFDLEARFGTDRSDGFAYRMALGSLREYQESLLTPHGAAWRAWRRKCQLLFRSRVRAIGWLLALRKRSVERMFAPGGTGYELCRVEFEATCAASRTRRSPE